MKQVWTAKIIEVAVSGHVESKDTAAGPVKPRVF